MSAIETFRQRHAELTYTVEDVRRRFEAETLKKRSSDIAARLMRLRKMAVDYVNDLDADVFPLLIEDADTAISESATELQAATHAARDSFVAYIKKWGNSLEIMRDPQGFLTESAPAFDAFRAHLDMAAEKLYPETEADAEAAPQDPQDDDADAPTAA
ncbi:MAG: hypothetical protein ACFB2Z_11275 [Maricaulaceae bacterium]